MMKYGILDQLATEKLQFLTCMHVDNVNFVYTYVYFRIG